ncbi:MAG TPA: hypothetical protein VFZ70_09585 [Euzebyales bacterium]
MGLPDIDANGNLPPGRHDATVDEVRATFVDPFVGSHTRRAIFDWWTELRDALRELGAFEAHWLAGSFVTDKAQPNDLDLITVIDGAAFDEMPRHRRQVMRSMVAGHVTEELWRCDNYPVVRYPDGDAGQVPARAVATMWEAHFGTDRDGNTRGFVVVQA